MVRPRAFNEDDVVAAGRDIFWSQGYAATRIDDLTEATGLGRGSLYGAFGDKHTMFMRGLDEYCSSVTESFRADLHDSARPAYHRLVAHLRSRAGSVAADTKRRGCLMAKSAAELGATDAEVFKLVKQTHEAWLGELSATIAAAQRDGDLAPEANPRELASLLLAVVRGIEALRTAGTAAATITAAVESAIALLPKTPSEGRARLRS
jgi:TetR/AcrR family transcriptional repressor of nem operon|nr:TetR/AcrR family transcriptional regulator [Rhodococcus wratislaviensis]GLK33775.1 TetR family transcriptional regulator [Rhodococcus wratislaviensis]